MKLVDKFYANINLVLAKIRETQTENILVASHIISETIQKGGIIQAFGSGHSFSAAIEVAGRAGGYVGSKAIHEFYGLNGWFEVVENVESIFVQLIDRQPNDCFIFISNSGRNPLHIEMASYIKEKGHKLIVVTNLADSMSATSRHSNGLKLYQFADVILDNCGFEGDCSINVEKYNVDIAPTSSISAAYILEAIIIQSIENLIKLDIEPPILKSINMDGGREYNQKLFKKYKDRLRRV